MLEANSDLIGLTRSSRDPRVAIITMNRPASCNAFDEAMARALYDAMSAFEADESLRVAVLRGEGPVFCAGMDLAAFAAGERPGLADKDGFVYFVRRPRVKPMIAAVQGGAFGGGFEIMLACDLAVAAEGTRFGLPEVKRGILAAAGGAVRLPLRLPSALAREMLLTGDPIDAERAAVLGLVNRVVPAERLLDAALDLASAIAGNAPLSVAASRRICEAAAEQGEAAGWAVNAVAWTEVETSEDALEGVRAFKAKRDPVWQGR